ncbi:hypothetical protein CHM34_18575 [Paludifilum halophilum]|uniref:Uncharacterized protein n=1 Tax=Paludifilum halophilum TaxID=1642702 RepID=A0A235B145_9BACL|nr:hypothetical protein CHM34_18575 [Paludifilum halophilum]
MTTNEANIKAKLTIIQATITPHIEILHKEQGYAETLMKKDPNLSTIHLATKLEIQIKSLDLACENRDATLKMILDVHKSFLDQNTT